MKTPPIKDQQDAEKMREYAETEIKQLNGHIPELEKKVEVALKTLHNRTVALYQNEENIERLEALLEELEGDPTSADLDRIHAEMKGLVTSRRFDVPRGHGIAALNSGF